jgi:FdhD protein
MAATSRAVPARSIDFAREDCVGLTRAVPVEAPVSIVYGNVPYAVMMATPADFEDFAIGFSLTEGIIEQREEIRGIAVEEAEKGWRLVVTLSPDRFRVHLARTRSLSGRTGCGLCGIGSLEELPEAKPVAGVAPVLTVEAVARAVRELDGHQPLNDLTRAVHGAAWCDLAGDIRLVREDVGRHNALDKLIGALLGAEQKPAEGFLLITSRCSFEMVEKAARFGAHHLVAVSAPTSLALERAEALGLGLIAVARRDSALVFEGALPETARKGAA